MSHPGQTPSQKRKHNSRIADSTASAKKLKKHAITAAASAEIAVKERKKDKGKAKASESEFRDIEACIMLSIPPIFADDLRSGAEEMLDSMLMRYIPAFQGVVLAHSNLHFLRATASIIADCPFSVCKVGFTATVWCPHVGMKLVGKINLCSPDHISLLVHRTFNVSIPRRHIPADNWEFEHGPAENDPEFGYAAMAEQELGGTYEAGGADGNEDSMAAAEGGGRWIHRLTADVLGGAEGFLEFMVVGLTVANEMLSLVGSIQPDPFLPEHFTPLRLDARASSHASSVAAVDAALEEEEEEEEEMVDEFQVDTFEHLGRLADEAAAQRQRERDNLLAAEEQMGEKKKKRKKENGEEGAGKKSKKAKSKDKKEMS